MKKLFALLLVSGALFTFTSCDSKKSEEATEETATEEVTEEVTTEDATMDTAAVEADTAAAQ